MNDRKAILTGACLTLLIVSAAHADDEFECQIKLTEAESLFNEKINEKVLSDDAIEEANLLLDEADEACSKGEQKDVRKALNKVNEIVSSTTSETLSKSDE